MAAAGVSPVLILLIEDNPADADLIQELLEEADAAGPGAAPLELVRTDRLAGGEQRLGEGDIGVVLLDLSLPDSQGLESFRRLRARFPNLPVVVLSGLDDQILAAQAVREGAQDYLVKGRVDADLLVRALRYAIERQRAEAERARLMRERGARAEAEAALREHSALLVAICHDLRNPLASIRAQAQLLSRRLALGRPTEPERLREGLDRIDENTGRIARMLDELVDVAHLQAGGLLELHREPLDLVAMARRLVAGYQVSHESHRLRLAYTESELVGEWDGPRLERVLENLLANAVKYSPEGSDVVVSVEQDDRGEGPGWAVLRVRDRGVGIPAADLPHVFDRFFRGRNVTARTRGMGIGLAGARQIVEQHGGTVGVESQEGEGSTFTVCLPL